jgi:Lipoprotein LpqB beta-propeller domain/Sporulation and spore germination
MSSGGALGRLRWVLGLVAVTVSLAGCVSMQDSGPPGSLQANPADTTQNPDYDGPIAVPPGPNWSPAQIVNGFLAASATYSTAPATALAYLTTNEASAWNPKWSATVFKTVTVNAPTPPRHGWPSGKPVTVTAAGAVQATLSGSGDYLAVAQSGTTNQPSSSATGSCGKVKQGSSCQQFTLVQTAPGQWRISKPPPYLLLDESDFSRAYQPQDLYFFGPNFKVLVPDTVFVPLGTSAQQLLTTLVTTLIAPQGTWLAGATQTSFPPKTTLLGNGVTILASTVKVNLGGAIAQASQTQLTQALAQLTWTLAGSPGGLTAIQNVEMEINGVQWSSTKTQAQYSQFAPYPAGTGIFTYLDNGTVESRCGLAGTAAGVPVFGASGALRLATCDLSASSAPSPTTTPATHGTTGQTHPPNQSPLSMAAASPDWQYLAGVSPGNATLTIWPVNGHGGPVKWSQPDATITSISWDRQDDLWLTTSDAATQSSSIYMVSAVTGRSISATFDGAGNVTALNVAPDGVRVALIVKGPSGEQVELAAIEHLFCSDACRRPGTSAATLIPAPPLGSGLTATTALAWYDADDLIVINQGKLWRVPVNGRSATELNTPALSPGAGQLDPAASTASAVSVAANSGDSGIVVGMSDGQLMISPDIDGTSWQVVGPGEDPAYGVNE